MHLCRYSFIYKNCEKKNDSQFVISKIGSIFATGAEQFDSGIERPCSTMAEQIRETFRKCKQEGNQLWITETYNLYRQKCPCDIRHRWVSDNERHSQHTESNARGRH